MKLREVLPFWGQQRLIAFGTINAQRESPEDL